MPDRLFSPENIALLKLEFEKVPVDVSLYEDCIAVDQDRIPYMNPGPSKRTKYVPWKLNDQNVAENYGLNQCVEMLRGDCKDRNNLLTPILTDVGIYWRLLKVSPAF